MSTCHNAWICLTRHQQKHHQALLRCLPSNNISRMISPKSWWGKDQSTRTPQSKTSWLSRRWVTWGRTSLLMEPLQIKRRQLTTLRSVISAKKNLKFSITTSAAAHTCLFCSRPQVLRADKLRTVTTERNWRVWQTNVRHFSYTSHVI